MDKKIITRISNEIGNQLFMYASTFAIARKLNRKLIIDNESAFKSRKNISSYALHNFNISSKIAEHKFKYLGLKGYLKRKLLKKIDFFKTYKVFYLEKKDYMKITKYQSDFLNNKMSDILFMEGYFETEKYFNDIKEEILNEFKFKNAYIYVKSSFYPKLNIKNSVSICLRQNRFLEGKNKKKDTNNYFKSENFNLEQISYINQCIDFFISKLDSPSFFLWSNNTKNIDKNQFNTKINIVDHNENFLKNIDKRALDLFLISQCNHHIVVPSSFNWWGAWLSQKKDKIICRPSNDFFSNFRLNNLDFWPDDWIEIKR